MPLCNRRSHGHSIWSSPMLVVAALTFAGCDSGQTVTAPPPKKVADDGHDHPSEGPHHGDLVELGNEEYHAEIVHGDGGAVTVHMLDSSAKAAVPIDATEVLINMTHDGQPEQFKLAATPESGEPQGKSSRFNLVDAELAKHLDEEGAAAKLVITIAGKQYTGKIEHHHDHQHAH
jgi:hypothetical protein